MWCHQLYHGCALGLACGALGLPEACLDESLRYADERQTFGMPIGQHQLVQQMIAKTVRRIGAGRLLCYQVSCLKNQGMRNTRETSQTEGFMCDAPFDSAQMPCRFTGLTGTLNHAPDIA